MIRPQFTVFVPVSTQSDTPRFCPYFMHMHAPIAEIEGDVGAVRKIVREKLLDETMAFVTEAQDENRFTP